MKTLTEVVEGQRSWTKESIFKILKYAHDKRSDSNDLVNFLDQGLKEANFTPKKPRTVLNRTKHCWVIRYDQWRYQVYVWVSSPQKVELKIDNESYNDLGDLIYLWDKVRSSWELKKPIPGHAPNK
jgi:hypothetical protein